MSGPSDYTTARLLLSLALTSDIETSAASGRYTKQQHLHVQSHMSLTAHYSHDVECMLTQDSICTLNFLGLSGFAQLCI